MRARRRHSRSRGAWSHGYRAAPLAQAAFYRTCEMTFPFGHHPQGISMDHPGFPDVVHEDAAALLWGVEEMAIETIRPEAFEPGMSGDELLAWLEHSLQGAEEH